MALDLRGQRVLLTGASGGLGRALARELASCGANLVLTGRSLAKLREIGASCEALGVQVELHAVDLCDAEARAQLVARALERGKLDVLINNAGVEFAKGLLAQTEAEVAAQLRLNLDVPIALTRALLPAMLERGRGVVVNVSSMSGKGATPHNSIYAATKFALVGFSASLRLELEGTGVHVGVVCPGFVSAGMWAHTGMRAPRIMREVSPEQCARAVARVLDGAGEVLVTAGPIRPFLALFALSPRLEGALMRLTGVRETLARRAALVEAREVEEPVVTTGDEPSVSSAELST